MSSSAFDPDQQARSTESKILVALERVSEAFRVLLWQQSKTNGLSPIQIQMLIFLRFHAEEMRTVTALAKEFNLAKATVSESVKTLLKKSLVEKVNHPKDTRSFRLALTKTGRAIAEEAGHFTQSIETSIAQLTGPEKEHTYSALLSLIQGLNQNNILAQQRMCQSCAHYQVDVGKHFCKLLQTPLKPNQLRVDCPEHKAV